MHYSCKSTYTCACTHSQTSTIDVKGQTHLYIVCIRTAGMNVSSAMPTLQMSSPLYICTFSHGKQYMLPKQNIPHQTQGYLRDGGGVIQGKESDKRSHEPLLSMVVICDVQEPFAVPIFFLLVPIQVGMHTNRKVLHIYSVHMPS